MRREWWKGKYSTKEVLMEAIFCLSFFLFVSSSCAIPRSNAIELTSQLQDVVSLLTFKQSSVDIDPQRLLTNWVLISTTPCAWHGVSCSNGQPTALDLTNGGLVGRLHLDQLIAVPTLVHVRLSGNYFYGNLSSQLSDCRFQTLDLSSNNFSQPLDLSPSCDRLVYLNLSKNSIPGGRLTIGSDLLQLDLSQNQISDSSLFVYTLSHCQNLNLLNFSDNKLGGNLGNTLVSCNNPVALDLSNNFFSGEIPPSLMAHSFKILDLSTNNFTGDFSRLELGSCLNLTTLILSHNRLFGTDFPISLTNCQLLETLDVGYNALHLMIDGLFFGNFKRLRQLYLARNHIFGEIPPELGQICGSLEVLDLSGNKLTGGLPPTFAACSSLFRLDLSNNQLSGNFLDSVISLLPSLKYLSVSFNNLTGPVPRSLTNCTQLQVLDLSANGFTGNVPHWFCSSASSSAALEKLFLSNNYLTGTVPSELGKCRNLKTIDLSFNDLVGEIPLEIWTLPFISELVMWANSLSGEIPEGICINGGNLQTLILNNNLISGTLPLSIANCTNLNWVSLSGNRLTGEMPSGIGNLVNLAILQMGNNSLTGEIPKSFGNCRSLVWLDLNSNNLTGPIPSELATNVGLVAPGPISGKHYAFVRNEGGTACRGAGGLVEFEGIRPETLAMFLPMVRSCSLTRIYSGITLYTFPSNGSMIYLDISYNSLSGTVPKDLGSMSFLQVLNLGHNNLTGNIPDSLGGLMAVGVLDLSHNQLEGSIPRSLGKLSFLSDLDVSNNNLTGPIPSGGQLTTFPASRYANNSGLCGLPLPSCEYGKAPQRSPISHLSASKQGVNVLMVIGIGSSLFCIIMLLFSLYRLKKHQKKEEKREKYIESLPTSGSNSWKLSSVPQPLSINVATFEKPLRKLTFSHLLEATNGFSANSLIGSGGFGEVYKAQLEDDCVVAIKKLIHVTGQGDREFVAEMETIGKIKHRNLVPLLGYCKIGEERLLVYDYMKWGSLESVLHENAKNGGSKLDWAARKKISIGSARGLAFLHHSCIPHIIHRDMKSSNVLLDEDFEARVSDFGMARLVNALDTHLSVSTLAGTPGYVPPEYYQSFRCTTKGDVYSYGVVLLELLSGKRPIDPLEFGDDNNLVGWAKLLQKEKRSPEILDPELITHESSDAELFQYLRIAFQCLDDRPFRRPTMIQVMTMFKDLQTDSECDVHDGVSLKSTLIEEHQESTIVDGI